jgi:hypothetical protein
MTVAAYLRITKGMQRKTKEIVVWWKTGLGNRESSPLLSRTLLSYFRGVVQINLESLCPQESCGHCLGTVYQLAGLMVNGLEASEE